MRHDAYTPTRFHRHPRRRHVGEPLLNRLRGRSEATLVYDFTILVERAVMTPNIPKVDADRRANPRLSAWDFRDECSARFFMEYSLLLRENLIPFSYSSAGDGEWL